MMLEEDTEALQKVILPPDCKLLKLYDESLDMENSTVAIFENRKKKNVLNFYKIIIGEEANYDRGSSAGSDKEEGGIPV